MAALNLKRYYEGQSKLDKTAVVQQVLDAMREASPSGGFLKPDSSGQTVWLSVGERETKEKIGHCMRDMIAAMREEERRKEQFEIFTESKCCDRPLLQQVNMPREMTAEQRLVLRRLESGYDGPVDKLLKK